MLVFYSIVVGGGPHLRWGAGFTMTLLLLLYVVNKKAPPVGELIPQYAGIVHTW